MVFKVKGQGHTEVNCTYPAEGYPSMNGRPSVVHAAEIYRLPIDGVASRLTCYASANNSRRYIFRLSVRPAVVR